MKIYTKTGDDGTTGLLAGSRLPKDSLRIEAYGTVDELNAVLGVARAVGLDPHADEMIEQVQDDLFAVGSALADPNPRGRFHGVIDDAFVTKLEREIDALETELPPLNQFILPGGSLGSAQLHLARTVCRRAERAVVRLANVPAEDVSMTIIVYLNRLSDFLFVLARAVNQRAGVSDLPWSGL